MYNMSVLTHLTVPGEARPLKIAPPRRRFIRLVIGAVHSASDVWRQIVGEQTKYLGCDSNE